MFSFFKKDNATLQLYGKLPLAKDYLRLGCGHGNARALRDWLDGAYSSSPSLDGNTPVLANPMRIIFALDGAEPVLANAWPSSDAGGQRRFPYMSCVESRRKDLQVALEAVESGGGGDEIERVFLEMEALHERWHDYPDSRSLLDGMRGHALGSAPPQDASGNSPDKVGRSVLGQGHLSVSPAQWIDALWPTQGEEGLYRILLHLRALIQAGYSGPLRLPLAPALPIQPQVHAWCHSLRELEILGSDLPPALFYPAPIQSGNGAPSRWPFLCIFNRAPAAQDAAWLEEIPEGSSLGPADLCVDGPSTDLAQQVQQAQQAHQVQPVPLPHHGRGGHRLPRPEGTTDPVSGTPLGPSPLPSSRVSLAHALQPMLRRLRSRPAAS